jgi:hypothetical protein
MDTYTPHGVVDLDLFSEVCRRNQKTFSITSLAFLITPKVNQQEKERSYLSCNDKKRFPSTEDFFNVARIR